MRIAFLTSLGHSEKKKKKAVSCGRSDNGLAQKDVSKKNNSLPPYLFSPCSLVAPRSSYVNAWNRLVECYSPGLLGLRRPWRMKLSSNCIIVRFIRSLIQQLLSILLPHHLHFFPTSASDPPAARLAFSGTAGLRLSYLPNGIIAGD